MVRNIAIRIDQQKCIQPTECRACLERCPGCVFLVYPEGVRKPGKAATGWRIAPAFIGRCTGCMICVKACPGGAVEVHYLGREG